MQHAAYRRGHANGTQFLVFDRNNIPSHMPTKPASELTVADFETLIGLSENRYLDFKSAPVGEGYDEHREFLADVSAFANASGGDIVFGVMEQDSVATGAPGITPADANQEKLRLADLIRNALEAERRRSEIWSAKYPALGAALGYEDLAC